MTTIEKKSLKVGKYVNTKHVDSVIRNYKHERWVHNSEHIGKEDSLSAWYSVEELEEFISSVKRHGGDGIKIYFGAYPKNFEEVPEYAGRQTLVLVATKRKESEEGETDKDIYINTEEGCQILAYNMSRLCPPYCGGGSGGGNGEDDWGGVGITIVDRKEKGFVIL